MPLSCDICSLIPWLWLLWERCANPLIAGSFLSQAGGEERNGNWLWGPPPLPLLLQSQRAKMMWMDEVNYFAILWKGFPFLWWDSANASCLLFKSQSIGKLWCHVCSPLPTILMHPAASLKPTFETLTGIQGCLNSAITFQEWAGQDISRYRLRSGGLSWSPIHTGLHTLGHARGILLYLGMVPIRGAAGFWQQKNLCFSHSLTSDAMTLSLLKKSSSFNRWQHILTCKVSHTQILDSIRGVSAELFMCSKPCSAVWQGFYKRAVYSAKWLLMFVFLLADNYGFHKIAVPGSNWHPSSATVCIS